MIPIKQARDENRCRICEAPIGKVGPGPDEDKLVLNYGNEYAHGRCVERLKCPTCKGRGRVAGYDKNADEECGGCNGTGKIPIPDPSPQFCRMCGAGLCTHTKLDGTVSRWCKFCTERGAPGSRKGLWRSFFERRGSRASPAPAKTVLTPEERAQRVLDSNEIGCIWTDDIDAWRKLIAQEVREAVEEAQGGTRPVREPEPVRVVVEIAGSEEIGRLKCELESERETNASLRRLRCRAEAWAKSNRSFGIIGLALSMLTFAAAIVAWLGRGG